MRDSADVSKYFPGLGCFFPRDLPGSKFSDNSNEESMSPNNTDEESAMWPTVWTDYVDVAAVFAAEEGAQLMPLREEPLCFIQSYRSI